MIKHLVFFNFKQNPDGPSTEELASDLKRRLLALKNVIPEIVEIDCGADFNESDAAWDFALHTSFNTRQDLDAYQKHPEHEKVKEFIGTITTTRAVVDYEV